MVKLLRIYNGSIPGSAMALAAVAALGRSQNPGAEAKLTEIFDSAIQGSATCVAATNALGVLRRSALRR